MSIASYAELKRAERLARLAGHAEVAEDPTLTRLERLVSARRWYAVVAAAALVAVFTVWQVVG